VSTRQNRLLAALRPLSIAASAAAIAVSVTSQAYANPHILVDVQTGRVLEHEDAFRKWYPASLTKLMTVYTCSTRFARARSASIRLS
jgi:D-alanyl-D-alanine carboxypeptidase